MGTLLYTSAFCTDAAALFTENAKAVLQPVLKVKWLRSIAFSMILDLDYDLNETRKEHFRRSLRLTHGFWGSFTHPEVKP